MALKRKNEPASPERTALGEAIQAALAARRARDAALTTEEPAQRAVRAAEEAVEDARERLSAAKSSAADEATGRMLDGDVLELPPALRAARSALAEAEDRLDLARTTRDRLNTRRADLDSAVARTQAEVVVARDAVLRAEGTARAKVLAKEMLDLQRRVAAVADEIGWLAEAHAMELVDEPGPRFGEPADESLRYCLTRVDPWCRPLHGHNWVDLVPDPAPSALWAAAAAALETDPTAPLPGADR